MQRTNLTALGGTALFVLAGEAIVTPSFYGSVYAIPVSVSFTLWIMAAICVGLTLKVRGAKAEGTHGIGLDNSQLNPMTVANFMLLGKASAWTGTIVGSAYGGIGIYVLAHLGQLSAASEDLPGVIACVTGGLALAVAGLVLERNCEVPPPPDGAGAVH